MPTNLDLENLSAKLQARLDYTRAVISERDQYMENTIWQAKRIAELKEANSSLAGASIVPDVMVLISRKELAELRLQIISDIGQEIDAEPKAEPVRELHTRCGMPEVCPEHAHELYTAPQDGLRKAAQMALDAIEELRYCSSTFKAEKLAQEAQLALRKELGQ